MTKYFDWRQSINEEELNEVISCINNGGIIIFPTDTVYGIGCSCFNERAINKIFKLKIRDKNKPINVLTDNSEKISLIAKNINKMEMELIEKYMPGALTIILDKKESVPSILTANLDTIGVRIPNNDIAIKILSKLDFPLATTSVNYSGEKPSVKVEDFYEIFKDSVDFIIDAGPSPIGEASTIVRVENNKYEVLREGSIRL